MKIETTVVACAALLACGWATAATPVTAVTGAAPLAGHAASASTAGVAWRYAASDADVDAAFAQARSERKPVFVYWGAKWCPPCNQVKATVFNRQDFIERSRAFVAVYVDGDSPGAQKLGTRFAVRGYPTMVLFSPSGDELTRLPGEVDGAVITRVLTLAMNAQRPVKQVLAQALASGATPGGGKPAGPLTANDWRLLAFYSWETDEQQLVPKAGVAALLARLADACPATLREAATRLRLKALAAGGAALNADAAAAAPAASGAATAVDGNRNVASEKAAPAQAAARTRLLQVLADPAQSRTHMDVLTNSAADLVTALAGPARQPAGGSVPVGERASLAAAFDGSLKRLQADATLSRADRVAALLARVELAKPARPAAAAGGGSASVAAAAPPLPAALLGEVRDTAARADREIRDPYERQAVVTAAAWLLSQAGLAAESDALLQANLSRSHSPYYLMSDLAHNARQRGDSASALRWSEQAFNAAEGPATRLQWGASYIAMLVDLAPADEARIERVARQLFGEAARQPDAFFERSGRSLKRVATKLVAWNAGGTHAAALQRLQAEVDAACTKLPAGDAQRASCEALFKAPPAKAA